ncbi:MAG TPA: PH domain-containing protein, partial [Woeseiaceae bacterium]|nr:PH domain-containing protein [Woeseiaceae bacterium]
FGAVEASFGTALALAVAVALAVLVILLGASIAGALLRHYGYALGIDGDVLRSLGGLLTRHEQSVHRAKVQSFQVVQNAVLRRLRRYRLRLRQATSGRGRTSSRFDVPLCERKHLSTVAREVFREEQDGLILEPDATAFRPISRFYLRSRILLRGVLPALAGLVLALPFGAAALLALLWIPLVALMARLRYRRYGFAVAADGMSFRSGLFGWRLIVWLHRKVQRVTLRQSPFQRRRGLATLKFYLAAGSVTVPFVEYAAAAHLRDYVLYRVESSHQAWH